MALSPPWFLGAESIFDLAFLVVSLLIALRAYQAYKFFDDRRYLMLSVGFSILALSYLVFAATHFLVYLQETGNFALGRPIDLQETIETSFDIRGLLFLIGLAVLVLLYHKVEKRGLQAFVLLLVLFAYALSGDASSTFYILASILLLFITLPLYKAYKKSRKAPALLVLAGFIALLVGRVILGMLWVNPSAFTGVSLYVFSRMITLAGFLCILASQWRLR